MKMLLRDAHLLITFQVQQTFKRQIDYNKEKQFPFKYYGAFPFDFLCFQCVYELKNCSLKLIMTTSTSD